MANLSTIQNLIIPYIGSMEMQKLKPYHMENLYTTLSKTPCGSIKIWPSVHSLLPTGLPKAS